MTSDVSMFGSLTKVTNITKRLRVPILHLYLSEEVPLAHMVDASEEPSERWLASLCHPEGSEGSRARMRAFSPLLVQGEVGAIPIAPGEVQR